MKDTFEVASGSIVGVDHRGRGNVLTGINNQDAVFTSQSADLTLIAEADGNSSCSDSEVGAKLAVAMLGNSVTAHFKLLNFALEKEDDRALNEFWRRVKQDMLTGLHNLAKTLGPSLSATVQKYFIFTLVGAIVTQTKSLVFSLGDGMYCVNGLWYTIGPYANNTPPALGYCLSGSTAFDTNSPELEFKTQMIMPTESVDWIVVGSDGVKELIAAQSRNIPGKDELVGPISQVWTNDLFFQNPDGLRRRLSLMNRTFMRIKREGGTIVEADIENGLFADDVTLAVARRKGAYAQKVDAQGTNP